MHSLHCPALTWGAEGASAGSSAGRDSLTARGSSMITDNPGEKSGGAEWWRGVADPPPRSANPQASQAVCVVSLFQQHGTGAALLAERPKEKREVSFGTARYLRGD